MNYEELRGKIEKAKEERKKGNYKIADQLANEVLAELDLPPLIEPSDEIVRLRETLRAEAILENADTNRRHGNYESALEQAHRVLAIAEEYTLIPIKPEAWYTIGNVYGSLGEYEKALEYFDRTLNEHRELGNKLYAAKVSVNIGIIYARLGSYEKALEYYNRAHEAYLELGDKSGVALVTGNIGGTYGLHGDFDRAIEYYNRALNAHQELGNKSSVAIITGNIGGAYGQLGAYDKALEYLKRSLYEHQELGNKSSAALVIQNIGNVYGAKKYVGFDPAKAVLFLEEAITLHTEIGDKASLINEYKNLAVLYEQEKRWEDSYNYFKKYHELEKEVLSEEATKQAQQMDNRRKIEESERDRQVKLARFQEQEKILLNILPAQIAERILEGEKRIADLHEHVSVFFSDIVGFTKLSQTVTPDELLTMLNEIFSEFDRIARKHGLEKIKTIGDAYMAVAGVPMDQEDHAERAAAFAIDVIEYMKEYRKTSKSELQIRVGLHCGKAIAGVIGENKFAYDLWGDSVNTASRMESHGESGRIHVSEEFRNSLKESSFNFIERGEMEIKGKGMMKTYFLNKAS